MEILLPNYHPICTTNTRDYVYNFDCYKTSLIYKTRLLRHKKASMLPRVIDKKRRENHAC